MWKNWKHFAKTIMRIVNEILLKILEKLKNNFYKVFESWKNLLKLRENLCTLLNIWDLLMIRKEILNNENILIFNWSFNWIMPGSLKNWWSGPDC